MPPKYAEIFLVLLYFLLIAGPNIAKAQVFSPKSHELDNGLQVVVIENDRAPVLTQMVWYKVGSMDEPKGKSGLAHYLEHLMFKATHKLEAGEFSKIVAANGGRDNAFTSFDYTGYFQSIGADRLPLVMAMEADRMVNLRLDAKVIEPERRVVLEERLSRIDTNPQAAFGVEVRQALYHPHPYGRPIIGWEDEINQLTLKDLTDFYARYYAPNNAILVVAGAIKAEKVFQLAEKYFGDIPASPVNFRDPLPPNERATSQTLIKQDKRIRVISWSRRYLVSSAAQGADRMTYALEVLNEILGGSNSARLYKSLVIDKALAVSAGSWYNGRNRGPSEFGFYAEPKSQVEIQAIEKILDDVLQDIIQRGVSDTELARTKQKLQDATILANDSLSYPARAIGAALISGVTIADFEAWPRRIAAVTKSDIQKAAQAVFAKRNFITAILEPE